MVFHQANSNPKYNYYQIFMYNFTRYIQWPSEAQDGDFIIGVYGNCEIIENLQKMASEKMVDSRPIKIEVYNSVNEIKPCHMLFLPEEKSDKFNDIKEKIAGTYTLLITEKVGLGKKGSGINFILAGSKLRFELNQEVTSSANLRVSTELVKMAILI